MTVKALKNDAAQSVAEAYLFVEVARGADPMIVLGTLSQQRIVEWDAVRDARYGIAIHLHGDDEAALESQVKRLLAAVDGVGDHAFVPVHQPDLGEAALERINEYEEQSEAAHHGRLDEQALSYLLIDVEPARLNRVYAGLYVTDEVVVLEADTRGSRLVAVVQSADFADLRRVVSDRIRILDGVAGVLEMKVIPRDMM
jgi:nitrate reductase NapAB chaperone NapD